MKKVVQPTPKGKALFDFDGEYDDELSFKVNMRMSLFCCDFSGSKDSLPSTFTIISKRPKHTPSPPPPPHLVGDRKLGYNPAFCQGS